MQKSVSTPNNSDEEHYEWGASAAEQWRGCKGSIAFTRLKKAAGVIPKKTSTVYSDEGSEAHDWADRCLKGEITKEDIPSDFLEHLDGYINLAREIAEANGGDVYCEQKVPYYYNTDKKGTLDYAVVSDDQVDILDLKYGAGIYVPAFEKDQLAIYALSLMAQFDEDDHKFTDDTIIRMHIYQPRHREFDGVPEIWETTYRDLQDIGIDIENDYHESKAASATDLTPSEDACQFCDARRVCTAKIMVMFDGIPDELNPLKGEVDTSIEITDEVRVRICKQGKQIAKFLSDTNDDSLALIEQGKQIAGMKTVDGKPGNRKWGSNELEADKLLRKIPATDRYQPKKLITPAVAEKVLKKAGMALDKQSTRFQNRWKELIQQKEGSPVLTLEDDPRKARASAIDIFDDETVGEDDCF